MGKAVFGQKLLLLLPWIARVRLTVATNLVRVRTNKHEREFEREKEKEREKTMRPQPQSVKGSVRVYIHVQLVHSVRSYAYLRAARG